MKISADDQRAIGLILFCVGVLCFLIGLAARLKENYHGRDEISSTGFTIAIILAAIGGIPFLVSLKKKSSEARLPEAYGFLRNARRVARCLTQTRHNQIQKTPGNGRFR